MGFRFEPIDWGALSFFSRVGNSKDARANLCNSLPCLPFCKACGDAVGDGASDHGSQGSVLGFNSGSGSGSDSGSDSM